MISRSSLQISMSNTKNGISGSYMYS